MITKEFVLIQFIGAIGYTLLAVSYYRKNKNAILFMQIIANIFFTLHYYLLSGIAGAISNVVGLVSYSTIYFLDKYNLKKEKNVFSLVMIVFLFVATLNAYENIYSLLPFIAFTFTIVSFLKGNEDTVRKLGIVGAECWLIYAIVYKSYVAIVFEVVTLIATIGALIKNRKLKTMPKEQQ